MLAVTPARVGSKEVYKKNIRDVGGKPLIYYQLRNALESKYVDQVVLASDSQEILNIGYAHFGGKIDYVLRPEEISTDESKSEETLLFVLDTYPADIVVLLEPTNPLNKPEYIAQCIEQVLNGMDSCGCFTEDCGFFSSDEDLIERPMRQHIVPRLRETGNCWATRSVILRITNNRLGGRFGTVVIPKCDSLHLDDETDWRCIEALLPRGDYYDIRPWASNGDSDDYWGITVDPDGKIRDKSVEREDYLAQHKNIIDYVNSLDGGRVLDVGCGLGFLLSALSKKFERFGLEPNPQAAKIARKNGWVFPSTLEESGFSSNFFDVVILNHVIEHLPDPVATIQEIRRVLKPGGKLVVETPDFDCEVARRFGEKFRLLDDETHISLFNTMSLYDLLKDSLFEVERIEHPFFEQKYFTEENLLRLFDTTKVSPPCLGNVVTIYCYKK